MTNRIINIKDISIFRSELMGWSLLWIMMLHFSFNQIKPLGFVAQYGYAGVELFIFVSGFGLFFSLDNNISVLHFYKNRLLRIFPTYYILGIFASIIIFHDNIQTYLFRYTTIGFWTNDIYWEWYIPSLIILYILAPLCKLALTRKHNLILCLIVIGCWGLSYLLIDREDLIDRQHFFLLYRIPAFIFGMVCGYWTKHNISFKYFLFSLLLGIPCFVLLYPHHHQIYNYKYYSLIFLLPFFTISLLIISKYVSYFNPILSAIGKASLEIYLIQSIFFAAILKGIITISPTWHDATTVLLIIISIVLGILSHMLIDKSGIYRLL